MTLPIVLAPVHPLIAHVRALPGSWYLTSELADALGTSAATLRRLARANPSLAPNHRTNDGRISVDVFDDAAVQRLSAHLRAHPTRRAGTVARRR
jgi:hypothetical protein